MSHTFSCLLSLYVISLLPNSTMLPTTSPHTNGALGSRDAARHTAGAKRYKYLRRLLHFRQMDFEFALWQMLYLFTSPQRVYRNFHYRKQTKDQWARDDPAFLALLSIWLCGMSRNSPLFSLLRLHIICLIESTWMYLKITELFSVSLQCQQLASVWF